MPFVVRDTQLLTSLQASQEITRITGRSCGAENVRRLAKIGQLRAAMIVGTQTRLFERGVVVAFAVRRLRGDEKSGR